MLGFRLCSFRCAFPEGFPDRICQKDFFEESQNFWWCHRTSENTSRGTPKDYFRSPTVFTWEFLDTVAKPKQWPAFGAVFRDICWQILSNYGQKSPWDCRTLLYWTLLKAHVFPRNPLQLPYPQKRLETLRKSFWVFPTERYWNFVCTDELNMDEIQKELLL